MMTFHVILEPAEDGWIVAECPALPGCVSQGRDEQEALANIREAIIAWLWAEDQKRLSRVAQGLFKSVYTKWRLRFRLSRVRLGGHSRIMGFE
jgi:predicted RNase H-like HicB family nuclease